MLVSLAMTWVVLASDRAAGLQEALRLEQQGDDAGAIARLDALVHEAPAWELPRLEAGRLRLKEGRSVDRAEFDLDVARSLAPENPRAHYLWALLCDERGRRREARASLEIALALRHDYGDARFRLATSLYADGAFAEAADAYGAYVAKHPEATAAQLQLAAAHERAGHPREAESALRALLKAPTTRAAGGQRLADLLERLGRKEEAAELRVSLAPPRRALRALQPSHR